MHGDVDVWADAVGESVCVFETKDGRAVPRVKGDAVSPPTAFAPPRAIGAEDGVA